MNPIDGIDPTNPHTRFAAAHDVTPPALTPQLKLRDPLEAVEGSDVARLLGVALTELELWDGRYCRLIDEAWRWRQRYERIKGATRERCIDTLIEELDEIIGELKRRGKDPGLQIALLMRLKVLLPNILRGSGEGENHGAHVS